ncbi:DUF5719 family protein [Streptomyces sp. SPB074]|uniref:DUF5719 family protein n=1 Tax=Streptomyces sp. (strain SPB074) TaxID=465543 RepID=UPI0001D1E200|nr:DUF5719 family protein [Streptomyces sp. SPB074]EDY44353.2 secreted protein [Streptomyces sp. SPB074]
MNRSTMSLFGAVAALAVLTGVAAATAPDPGAGEKPARAAAQPVQRSSLLCPAPGDSALADTTYTAFTPVTSGTSGSGEAVLRPSPTEVRDGKNAEQAPKAGKPLLTARKQGTPVSEEPDSSKTPSLVGEASGPLAPGWTVQQTTLVDAGADRALRGISCGAPDTDFWLPGVDTSKERSDYVHLTNPDDTAAVVDIALYGPKGELRSEVGEGIQIPPLSTVPVLLSTLSGSPESDLTAHVTATTGRISAAVDAGTRDAGGDWLVPAADPAPRLVLPGIPDDATKLRLVAFAPGTDDASLKVQFARKSSTIVPAGHENLLVKSGMTASLDLSGITHGEAGSLVLSPEDPKAPTPVVAALEVTRGKGGDLETAFIPATSPVGARASVTGNTGKSVRLTLSAPEAAAKVAVTTSAGTKGGAPATKTYTVPKATSQVIDVGPGKDTKGEWSLTVAPQPGSGPVHAARQLTAKSGSGTSLFTIQPLEDDKGMVRVPRTVEDLRVTED